jgi:S-layer homology domain
VIVGSKASLIFIGFLVLLTGCQGTDWGNSLQSAIAPSTINSENQSKPSQAAPANNLAPVSAIPSDVPIYGNVTLTGAVVDDLVGSGAVSWSSVDPGDRILGFYQESLPKQEWKLSDSALNPGEKIAKIKATKGNRILQVAVRTSSSYQTKIFLLYQPASEPSNSYANPPSSSKSETGIQPVPISIAFTDLATAPESLRSYIQDLSQLGILTAGNQNLFFPNQAVSRREMARWLFAANNQIYSDRPTRQIRPAQPSDRPSFSDIPSQDPDFAAIQGLVNAGLLRAGDPKTGNRFQPEATISREEALAWKVPFDVRQLGTGATVANVRQAWGFGDSGSLTPQGLQIVLADAQLGDQANIRRAFGFTKILQPQKPVTRVEAAAMLWRYGNQDEGNSAQAVVAQRNLVQGDSIQRENSQLTPKSTEAIPEKTKNN